MFLALKIPTLPLHYFVSPRKKYTSQCNTFSKFQFIYGIKKGKFQLSSIHQKQFHMLLLRRDGVKNDDLIFCYQKPCTLHTKYILQCILIWMGWKNLKSHSKYQNTFAHYFAMKCKGKGDACLAPKTKPVIILIPLKLSPIHIGYPVLLLPNWMMSQMLCLSSSSCGQWSQERKVTSGLCYNYYLHHFSMITLV